MFTAAPVFSTLTFLHNAFRWKNCWKSAEQKRSVCANIDELKSRNAIFQSFLPPAYNSYLRFRFSPQLLLFFSKAGFLFLSLRQVENVYTNFCAGIISLSKRSQQKDHLPIPKLPTPFAFSGLLCFSSFVFELRGFAFCLRRLFFRFLENLLHRELSIIRIKTSTSL